MSVFPLRGKKFHIDHFKEIKDKWGDAKGGKRRE